MSFTDYFYKEGQGPNSQTGRPNEFAGEWVMGGGVSVGRAFEAARIKARNDGTPVRCIFKNEVVTIAENQDPKEFAEYMGVSEDVLQKEIKRESATAKRTEFGTFLDHLRNN